MLTPDRRYIIVRGQLWRAANPALTSEQREQLVAALMEARRDVARATRAHDVAAERAARRIIHRTKVALGERGPTWWDDAPDYNRRRVENTPYADWYERQLAWEKAILAHLDERAEAASICPSEVARAEQPRNWRAAMSDVREAARRLAACGEIRILQKRKVIDPEKEFRGPIRLALAAPRRGKD